MSRHQAPVVPLVVAAAAAAARVTKAHRDCEIGKKKLATRIGVCGRVKVRVSVCECVCPSVCVFVGFV